MKVALLSDGAARGNPGLSGAGAVIVQEKKILKKIKKFLGNKTNNEAEYLALILGLEQALEMGVTEIDVYVDSELMQKQIEGKYKVKAPNLRPLFAQVFKLKEKFTAFSIKHIRREKNKIADALANKAIDERHFKISTS